MSSFHMAPSSAFPRPGISHAADDSNEIIGLFFSSHVRAISQVRAGFDYRPERRLPQTGIPQFPS